VLFRQLPRGNPSPPLWSAVRRGRCQLHDTVPPTPVRLTRRTLEGGPAAPSNVFSVLTQGHAVTSGRRDRSSPSLSTLCGHPRPCSATPRTAATTPALLERTGAGRCHARRCTPYGSTVNGTLESAHYGSQVANCYTTTSKLLLYEHKTCHDASTEQEPPGRPSTPRRCLPYCYM
jgi:hypothetical protein